jgi:DNA processing protein
MDDRAARMALSCVVDAGDPALTEVLAEYEPDEVWRAVEAGTPAKWAARAGRLRLIDIERTAVAKRIRFVVPGDDEWPSSLDDLDRCEPLSDRGGRPVGLWLRGPSRAGQVTSRSVGMVGSRAATTYGETVAGDIAAGLSGRGRSIVSGGAFGIDAASHRGALAGAAGTVAVLAGGLDRMYPAANTTLLECLAQEHLLVSEVPPGRHPTRVGFLARNRLIAALSPGVVVVEAAARSGARNTASWALRLGRVLMAVPGSVLSAASVTPNRLIRDSEAMLVTGPDDVEAALGPIEPGREPLLDPSDVRPEDTLDPAGRAVLEAFPATRSRTPAELAVASGQPYPACLAVLAELDERGLVEPVSGGRWRLRPASATRSGAP